MRETNITTGSAHARWLRDKKLALETAQLYAKGRIVASPASQYGNNPFHATETQAETIHEVYYIAPTI